MVKCARLLKNEEVNHIYFKTKKNPHSILIKFNLVNQAFKTHVQLQPANFDFKTYQIVKYIYLINKNTYILNI